MLAIAEANFASRPALPAFKPAFQFHADSDASDASLIKAIARGDRDALKVLYARHSVRIYRFAVRITANEAAAEDVVSDVFLEIWRNASRFKAESQVSTWLLAIARNKSVSTIRRRSEESLDAAVAIQDQQDDPEISACKTDRNRLVRHCLAQLSVIHREVVDLVYYHEKSVEEAAEILDVPANTVKTRMFYARRRMRDLLNAAGCKDFL